MHYNCNVFNTRGANEVINGKKPALKAGMILIMDDESQRQVLTFTPGSNGEVQCRTRKSHKGRWAMAKTFPRRTFWKGVDRVKEA